MRHVRSTIDDADLGFGVGPPLDHPAVEPKSGREGRRDRPQLRSDERDVTGLRRTGDRARRALRIGARVAEPALDRRKCPPEAIAVLGERPSRGDEDDFRIDACEALAGRLGVPPRTLDNWLWNRAQRPPYTGEPTHMTRTVFY